MGGYIEPFDVIFGENICLYVNEEGLGNCPPNRAVYATRNMVEEGYLSQMDYTSVVKEGELYTILWGDIVAVGFDPETGMDRDLTDAEIAQVGDYFTKVSAPGSGLAEALAIQQGRRREEPVQEHGVSLKAEADASATPRTRSVAALRRTIPSMAWRGGNQANEKPDTVIRAAIAR